MSGRNCPEVEGGTTTKSGAPSATAKSLKSSDPEIKNDSHTAEETKKNGSGAAEPHVLDQNTDTDDGSSGSSSDSGSTSSSSDDEDGALLFANTLAPKKTKAASQKLAQGGQRARGKEVKVKLKKGKASKSKKCGRKQRNETKNLNQNCFELKHELGVESREDRKLRQYMEMFARMEAEEARKKKEVQELAGEGSNSHGDDDDGGDGEVSSEPPSPPPRHISSSNTHVSSSNTHAVHPNQSVSSSRPNLKSQQSVNNLKPSSTTSVQPSESPNTQTSTTSNPSPPSQTPSLTTTTTTTSATTSSLQKPKPKVVVAHRNTERPKQALGKPKRRRESSGGASAVKRRNKNEMVKSLDPAERIRLERIARAKKEAIKMAAEQEAAEQEKRSKAKQKDKAKQAHHLLPVRPGQRPSSGSALDKLAVSIPAKHSNTAATLPSSAATPSPAPSTPNPTKSPMPALDRTDRLEIPKKKIPKKDNKKTVVGQNSNVSITASISSFDTSRRKGSLSGKDPVGSDRAADIQIKKRKMTAKTVKPIKHKTPGGTEGDVKRKRRTKTEEFSLSPAGSVVESSEDPETEDDDTMLLEAATIPTPSFQNSDTLPPLSPSIVSKTQVLTTGKTQASDDTKVVRPSKKETRLEDKSHVKSPSGDEEEEEDEITEDDQEVEDTKEKPPRDRKPGFRGLSIDFDLRNKVHNVMDGNISKTTIVECTGIRGGVSWLTQWLAWKNPNADDGRKRARANTQPLQHLVANQSKLLSFLTVQCGIQFQKRSSRSSGRSRKNEVGIAISEVKPESLQVSQQAPSGKVQEDKVQEDPVQGGENESCGTTSQQGFGGGDKKEAQETTDEEKKSHEASETATMDFHRNDNSGDCVPRELEQSGEVKDTAVVEEMEPGISGKEGSKVGQDGQVDCGVVEASQATSDGTVTQPNFAESKNLSVETGVEAEDSSYDKEGKAEKEDTIDDDLEDEEGDEGESEDEDGVSRCNQAEGKPESREERKLRMYMEAFQKMADREQRKKEINEQKKKLASRTRGSRTDQKKEVSKKQENKSQVKKTVKKEKKKLEPPALSFEALPMRGAAFNALKAMRTAFVDVRDTPTTDAKSSRKGPSTPSTKGNRDTPELKPRKKGRKPAEEPKPDVDLNSRQERARLRALRQRESLASASKPTAPTDKLENFSLGGSVGDSSMDLVGKKRKRSVAEVDTHSDLSNSAAVATEKETAAKKLRKKFASPGKSKRGKAVFVKRERPPGPPMEGPLVLPLIPCSLNKTLEKLHPGFGEVCAVTHATGTKALNYDGEFARLDQGVWHRPLISCSLRIVATAETPPSPICSPTLLPKESTVTAVEDAKETEKKLKKNKRNRLKALEVRQARMKTETLVIGGLHSSCDTVVLSSGDQSAHRRDSKSRKKKRFVVESPTEYPTLSVISRFPGLNLYAENSEPESSLECDLWFGFDPAADEQDQVPDLIGPNVSASVEDTCSSLFNDHSSYTRRDMLSQRSKSFDTFVLWNHTEQPVEEALLLRQKRKLYSSGKSHSSVEHGCSDEETLASLFPGAHEAKQQEGGDSVDDVSISQKREARVASLVAVLSKIAQASNEQALVSQPTPTEALASSALSAGAAAIAAISAIAKGKQQGSAGHKSNQVSNKAESVDAALAAALAAATAKARAAGFATQPTPEEIEANINSADMAGKSSQTDQAEPAQDSSTSSSPISVFPSGTPALNGTSSWLPPVDALTTSALAAYPSLPATAVQEAVQEAIKTSLMEQQSNASLQQLNLPGDQADAPLLKSLLSATSLGGIPPSLGELAGTKVANQSNPKKRPPPEANGEEETRKKVAKPASAPNAANSSRLTRSGEEVKAEKSNFSHHSLQQHTSNSSLPSSFPELTPKAAQPEPGNGAGILEAWQTDTEDTASKEHIGVNQNAAL